MPNAQLRLRSSDLQHRAFAGAPTSVDEAEGTFEIIVTTETPVVTWVPKPNSPPDEFGWMECVEADEVLEAAGLDYSRTPRMPLLDSHDAHSSIDKILGLVEDVRAEGQSIVARATLSSVRKYMAADIRRGMYGQVSAGYSVQEYEYVERPGQRLLAIAKRWTLQEASLVAIGADPYASIRTKFSADQRQKRSAEPQNNEEKSMELEELVTKAEDAEMAAAAAAQAVVDASDEGASEEVVARAKAIRAKRAEGDEPEKTDDAPAASADDDAKDTDEEKKEIEEVRALARSLGLSKIVDDGVKLRSSAKTIRAGLRTAYFARSAIPAQTQDVTAITKGQRDVDTKISHRSVYDNINGRSNAGGARSN
ncbi:hypothetical protein LJR098_001078 [Rhizobium sp. LjRoot98]|uniref:hypothetical protein n=1 Tax=Rhizobium sp. LjRoot98 TaxID=3342345 RepID=UPI003ECDE8CB